MPKKRDQRERELRRRVHEAFGTRVADARSERGLLQQEFGRRLGLSRTTISNIECGSQAVSLDQAYQMADALGLQVTALLPPMDQVFPPVPIHAAVDDPLPPEATEQAMRVAESVPQRIRRSASQAAQPGS